MTYYEEKGKPEPADDLQTVKESLLEENEKIKKFKEALKEKCLVYQQRIQLLKACSRFEMRPAQYDTPDSMATLTERCVIVSAPERDEAIESVPSAPSSLVTDTSLCRSDGT